MRLVSIAKFYISTVFIIIFSAVSLFGQAAKHVILISIDGFRPEFYLDAKYKTPHMRKLMGQGVHSTGVNSVFPSVTYPAHTTLVTGALPGRHGVYYNAPYGAKPGRWYWEESYIKTNTLWDAIRSAGMKSGSVMWPVTVGAPIDYNFPPRRSDDDENGDQLTVTMPFITPANLIAEVEKETGKLKKSDFNASNTIDQTIGKMANHIISKHKPNLMAIHFVTIDHLQHDHSRDAKEVTKGVAMVDSIIGSVVSAIDRAGLAKSTAIVITGDHGFVDTETALSPNTWLAQNGLLKAAKFQSTGGSTFLYLKDPKDLVTLEKVNDVLSRLPEDQKKLFQVVDRKKLDAAGANPEVALALTMSRGVAANDNAEGDAVRKKKKGGSHGYFPDFQDIRTGFIASGAGISRGGAVVNMGIKDVAPVVSELLGLNFKAVDGVLIPGIIKK